MRVDPEGIYLEIAEQRTVYGVKSGVRHAAVATLHWKEGRKWRRSSIIGDAEQSLGDVLEAFGVMLNHHGSLDALIAAIDSSKQGAEKAAGNGG